MSLLKKLLGIKSNKENEKQPYNPHAPEKKLPVDDRFMKNFIENGGKFVYCENLNELSENFLNILEENDWFECETLCFDNRLQHYLIENKLNFKDVTNPLFFFTSCENLIADEGAILFTSNQIKHFKQDELPKNLVIFATTSQIVETKSDSLREIKNKHYKEYPTNITALKFFNEKQEEDFLNYGSVSKNLYLLLLEDL